MERLHVPQKQRKPSGQGAAAWGKKKKKKKNNRGKNRQAGALAEKPSEIWGVWGDMGFFKESYYYTNRGT